MTLNAVACRAIVYAMRRENMSVERAFNDARIAAWLVWSMRGKPVAKEDYKAFNRARRVLQRAGRIRV